jgi:hypothetical protein
VEKCCGTAIEEIERTWRQTNNSNVRRRGNKSGGRKKAAMSTAGTTNQHPMVCRSPILVRFNNLAIIFLKAMPEYKKRYGGCQTGTGKSFWILFLRLKIF